MKKNRMIGLLCAIAMCMTIVLPVSAANNSTTFLTDNGVMITETSGVRTAVAADNTTEYTVVYDRINNTISMTAKDLQTGTMRHGGNIDIDSVPYPAPRNTITQDTSSGFLYTIVTGSQYEWRLERPKTGTGGTTGRYYFKVYENVSNETELVTFKDEVNVLAEREAAFVNKSSSAMMKTLAAGLLSGFAATSGSGILGGVAITAIIDALDVKGDAREAGELVAIQCNNCMYAIEDVYYATDNIHH